MENDICPACNGSGEGYYSGDHKCQTCKGSGIEKLKAENARYREALNMIIEGTDNKYPHPCSLDHEEINGVAREALKGGE